MPEETNLLAAFKTFEEKIKSLLIEHRYSTEHAIETLRLVELSYQQTLAKTENKTFLEVYNEFQTMNPGPIDETPQQKLVRMGETLARRVGDYEGIIGKNCETVEKFNAWKSAVNNLHSDLKELRALSTELQTFPKAPEERAFWEDNHLTFLGG